MIAYHSSYSHLGAPTRPSTPKVFQAREHVFNSLLFRYFHFRLTFESIKELGSASQMVHFEMGLEVIIVPKCPCASINGAMKFVVNWLINNNSTNYDMDLISWLMHQLVMSIMLVRSGKKNVTLKAFEFSLEYRLIIYVCEDKKITIDNKMSIYQ